MNKISKPIDLNDEQLEQQSHGSKGAGHCGYVALIGRPNVGKSTLLNHLIGQKVSITTPKPQTTRHRILGIQTKDNAQIIYVDTPGLQRAHRKQLNRYMNRVAATTVHDGDLILFLVEALEWKEDDEWILSQLSQATCKIFLLVNKVDRVKDKSLLLPFIEKISQKIKFEAIFPISARKGTNLPELETAIIQQLPENPFYFPADQLSDRNEIFMLSELIREQLMRMLGEELPYATTVEIEKYELKNDVYHIHALIWVERLGQKKIIIGEGGQQLKKIGSLARIEMEKMLNKKVFLKLWVKVKENWADDENLLKLFGYHSEL